MSTTLLSLSDEIAKLDDLLAAADNAEDKEVQEAIARLLDLTSQYPDRTAGELAAASLGELDFHTVCRRVSALERADLIDIDDIGRECRVRGTVQRTYRVKENRHA